MLSYRLPPLGFSPFIFSRSLITLSSYLILGLSTVLLPISFHLYSFFASLRLSILNLWSSQPVLSDLLGITYVFIFITSYIFIYLFISNISNNCLKHLSLPTFSLAFATIDLIAVMWNLNFMSLGINFRRR